MMANRFVSEAGPQYKKGDSRGINYSEEIVILPLNPETINYVTSHDNLIWTIEQV